MRKIKSIFVLFLIFFLAFSNTVSANNINSKKIDEIIVGSANVTFETYGENDNIVFNNWYKIREKTLLFGFEKLQAELLWSYNATNLNSNHTYEIFINFEANGKQNHSTIEVINTNFESGKITIEIYRKMITIILYHADIEIYKDGMFLDSDTFEGKILILTLNSKIPTNNLFILRFCTLIKNLLF